MTEQNQQQEQNQEQTTEAQADKFVWGPEDVEITSPEPAKQTETQETVDEAGALAENERQDKMTVAELTEEAGREMEQEENAEAEAPKAVHHATVKGANLAVARKEISADSCRAVVAGEITLQQAKAYGRDLDRHGNPVKSETPKKASKKSTEPTLTPCLCGCGELVAKRFKAGHDMVMFRVAREHLTEGREITDAQREYLETSGKMQRVKDKLAANEAKRQERIAAKAQKQREKEGAAEAKKRNAAD